MSDRFDIVVIGGGAGGLVVASGAAQFGARVALVEKERGLGGDCLYYGCVPTKTLVHSARVLSLIRRSEEFGLGRLVPSEESFTGAMERMRRMVARIGEHDDPKRFEAMGIRLFFGEGCFVDPKTFEVAGRRIAGRRFVLATGARPGVPPIPGLAEAGFLTNVTALALKQRPETMAIIGGDRLVSNSPRSSTGWGFGSRSLRRPVVSYRMRTKKFLKRSKQSSEKRSRFSDRRFGSRSPAGKESKFSSSEVKRGSADRRRGDPGCRRPRAQRRRAGTRSGRGRL
ncbi:MAG: FAD-dependent oxidoreductase [Candidatus Manganitrophus sp.]|nr:MAG: FAD-dependent oxidoreductase [Candidatus Manganitrophus sp.]